MTCINQNKGFTVVESLIVLAMGGLILIIVFLAIPTLQRNSRNTQRRQDVSTILSAISTFGLSNSGAYPNDCGPPAAVCGTGTGLTYNNDLREYDADHIFITAPGAVGGPLGPDSDVTSVRIYNHYRCDPNVTGRAISDGAGYYDVVAVFALESSSGTEGQCQQL